MYMYTRKYRHRYRCMCVYIYCILHIDTNMFMETCIYTYVCLEAGTNRDTGQRRYGHRHLSQSTIQSFYLSFCQSMYLFVFHVYTHSCMHIFVYVLIYIHTRAICGFQQLLQQHDTFWRGAVAYRGGPLWSFSVIQPFPFFRTFPKTPIQVWPPIHKLSYTQY